MAGEFDFINRGNVDSVTRILNLLDVTTISTRIADISLDHKSKYSAVTHAEILRHKMLGLNDANCAAACGISLATLQRWKQELPQLAADIEQAAALAQAEVVKLLFSFMKRKGPTAFNAVKFWLSSRTEEFKERAEVEVKLAGRVELSTAIRSIYGLSRSGVDAEQEALPPPEASAPPPIDPLDLGMAPQEPPKCVVLRPEPRKPTETTPSTPQQLGEAIAEAFDELAL